MASIKDIAELAGVGVGTVSRVLNGSENVSQATRERVEDVIKQLNFVPNSSACNLRRGRVGIVGLFIPLLSNPFFCLMADKIEALLDKHGYKMLVVCSQSDKNKEKKFLTHLAQNQVDGAIFITHHNLGEIDHSFALVTIDRNLGDNIPCITSDNYEATRKAIDYLYSTGSRAIGFCGGKPLTHSEVEERYRAYMEGTTALGMKHRVLYEGFKHGEDYVYATRFMDKYSKDVDSVICAGDVLAYTVYQVAMERGIRVPEDLRIISYDGVLDYWSKTPKFTSIVQNIDKMAQCVVEQLINKIKGVPCGGKIYIDTQFRLGETT